jgi:NADH dehydrogenase [ubiquinone] 1 alpha subcomplex assembly factor 7
MADMLRAVKVVPGFLKAARVKLIERSPTLQAVQQARLAATEANITWHADVPWEPGPTIVIANEFLDVFPIEQWRGAVTGKLPVSPALDAASGQTKWEQCHVEVDGQGRLAFTWLPAQQTSDDWHKGPARGGWVSAAAEQFKPGAVFEKRVNAHSDGFGREFCPPNRHHFAALAIDYGHVATAAGDTLQAVRNHHSEHPLTSPGEADLTAQVDFQEFAETLLERANLNDMPGQIAIDGPTTQAEFLGRLGIMERASRLIAANPARANEIETGVARLMSPVGMGTRFKAIGIRSPSLSPLPGF